MPGRRRSSFRFGDLAEDLGILLLKGIAAVAEVSRSEDVGLDAIATLLRRDDDGNSYAEDSFVVQLKSESESSIQYQDHELVWLLGQKQPMFIGRVSLKESRISLYPTLFVNHAVLALHATAVTIQFGPSELPPFYFGQKWGPWRAEGEDGATAWLGSPLLQWTSSDLVSRDWSMETYKILARFLKLARHELELISFGQCSVLDWHTNNLESITTKPGAMKGGADELVAVANRCVPGLEALMLRALPVPSDVDDRLMAALLALAEALKEKGVTIDPGNSFWKFFHALKKQSGESPVTGPN
jgi:hypothetical protein